jgi:uncharacterized protein
MAGPATVLREIHRLRKDARNLQDEIERVPRMLKAQQAKIVRQEEALREAQEVLKRAKLTTHEKESELKSAQQLIAKHEKQLSEATSKKEYDALKVEIAADKKKSQVIEDKILESMVAAEDKSAQIPTAEKAVAQAKADYADHEKTSQVRVTELREQLAKVHTAIKEVESSLPPDVLPAYERLLAARGEDAMAAVQNRTCMACYTEITAQAFNDLMLSQFVLCKSCGRVLYLPE